MKKTDDEIILKIKELVDQGLSSRAIAEEIGKTRDAVLALMKRRGIKSKYFEHTCEEIICSNCKKKFKSLKSSKSKFCSQQCSAIFLNKGRILSKETKNKISKTLSKPLLKLTCKCGKNFEVKNSKRNQIYCSNKCIAKTEDRIKTISKETKLKLSEIARKRHRRGDVNFGWSRRDNLKPSYPESIAVRLFNELGISFNREVKVSKYFIDFVIFDNIAIEIDGKQHEKPERKASDILKDEILTDNGFTVYRIKYPKENIIKRLQEIINSVLAQSVEHLTDIQEVKGS